MSAAERGPNFSDAPSPDTVSSSAKVQQRCWTLRRPALEHRRCRPWLAVELTLAERDSSTSGPGRDTPAVDLSRHHRCCGKRSAAGADLDDPYSIWSVASFAFEGLASLDRLRRHRQPHSRLRRRRRSVRC
ncbi:MAG: hypothetical protein MZW92_62615 [Comamonadaceae bacterium]|nr:hypothetical protein [Comamonadaceae bacterium]